MKLSAPLLMTPSPLRWWWWCLPQTFGSKPVPPISRKDNIKAHRCILDLGMTLSAARRILCRIPPIDGPCLRPSARHPASLGRTRPSASCPPPSPPTPRRHVCTPRGPGPLCVRDSQRLAAVRMCEIPPSPLFSQYRRTPLRSLCFPLGSTGREALLCRSDRPRLPSLPAPHRPP